jgi:molybdopterin-guanine dinucleotide biosynthesis protein A
MGRDKALLPFGPELMVERVARLLGEVVTPSDIVVVAAQGQSLPPLAAGISVVRDPDAFLGPLAGLATGLRELSGRVDAAYLTGCDVPLLVPSFVRRMLELLGDYDAAVPRDGTLYHPLAAVYRPSVLQAAEQLVAANQMRASALFDEVRTNAVAVEELRAVDPELLSLANVNQEAEYLKALERAGLTT